MNMDDAARKIQDDILRRMTPGQKLAVSAGLLHGARALKRAGLVLQHPDWESTQLDREVSRIFLHART
jgi:hypothetical protein